MKAIINIKSKRNQLSRLNGLTFDVLEQGHELCIDDQGAMLIIFDDYGECIRHFEFADIIIVDFQIEFQDAYNRMLFAEPKDASESRCYYFRLLKYHDIKEISFDPKLNVKNN